MIKTKRCTIKRFAKEHVGFLTTLVTDIKVRQYLGGIPSKQHIEKRVDRYLSNSKDDFWVVQEDGTGEFIGLISMNKMSIFRKAEISYEFLPNWWGKGYAIETIVEVIKHIFKKTKYKKLIAITQTKNEKSKKILESIGMQLVKKKIMFDEEQSIYHLKSNHFTY